MDKTRELLLIYQGKNGFDGVCHVRVYERPGQLPTVIAGALEDNPGTSITNAIELVAAAVQRSQFPEGREFRLIEHYPDTIDRRGTPTYALIHFEHRAIRENPDGASNYAGTIVVLGDDPAEEPAVTHSNEIKGDFRNPKWQPIHDIEKLLGGEVATWPRAPTPPRPSPGSRASNCATNWPRTPTAPATRSSQRSGRTYEGSVPQCWLAAGRQRACPRRPRSDRTRRKRRSREPRPRSEHHQTHDRASRGLTLTYSDVAGKGWITRARYIPDRERYEDVTINTQAEGPYGLKQDVEPVKPVLPPGGWVVTGSP